MIQNSDSKTSEVDPLIGRTLSHYTIQSRLGEDEAGIIYQARDNQAAKEIIVKVLRAAVAADSGRMERYKREAKRPFPCWHPDPAPRPAARAPVD